ncbi:hypothetical protein K492DRAFT_187846 [Lichtheimia hyalospora FSU 10163]|nr:hypothetical protein K492DRAFT_187846 [Lichtheimia hyalospora FSU 10163]
MSNMNNTPNIDNTRHSRNRFRREFMDAIRGNTAMEQIAAVFFDHKNLRELATIDAFIETLRDSGLFINNIPDFPRLCFWRQWDYNDNGGANAYDFSSTTAFSSSRTDAYVDPDDIQLPFFPLDDNIYAERLISEDVPSPAASSNGTDMMSVVSGVEDDNDVASDGSSDDGSDDSQSDYETTHSTTNKPKTTQSTTNKPTTTKTTKTTQSSTNKPTTITSTEDLLSTFRILQHDEQDLVISAQTFINAINDQQAKQQDEHHAKDQHEEQKHIEPIDYIALKDKDIPENKMIELHREHTGVLFKRKKYELLQSYYYTVAAINVFIIREHWRSTTGRQLAVLDEDLGANTRSLNRDMAALRKLLYLVKKYGVYILLFPEHLNIQKLRDITLNKFKEILSSDDTRFLHAIANIRHHISTTPQSMKTIEEFALFAENEGWLREESGQMIRFVNN